MTCAGFYINLDRRADRRVEIEVVGTRANK